MEVSPGAGDDGASNCAVAVNNKEQQVRNLKIDRGETFL